MVCRGRHRKPIYPRHRRNGYESTATELVCPLLPSISVKFVVFIRFLCSLANTTMLAQIIHLHTPQHNNLLIFKLYNLVPHLPHFSHKWANGNISLDTLLPTYSQSILCLFQLHYHWRRWQWSCCEVADRAGYVSQGKQLCFLTISFVVVLHIFMVSTHHPWTDCLYTTLESEQPIIR